MPRLVRLVLPEERTTYHIISRTALDGLPFKHHEKDQLVQIIRRFSSIFFVDVLGYAVMGNHFHLLARIYPESMATDAEVRRRYHVLYGYKHPFPESRLQELKQRFCSLSSYVKEIKQTFSTWYNSEKKRRGTLWGERFKSVIVQGGNAARHCLAYIDLNPVRAGIVKRPEAYRWCSMGYHAGTGNSDGFLTCDFGWDEEQGSQREWLRSYRDYLYHIGRVEKQGKARLADEIFEEARQKDFDFSHRDRFCQHTRYFTEGAIMGSRSFVLVVSRRLKGAFQTKTDKIPRPVRGLEGIYSIKRFREG